MEFSKFLIAALILIVVFLKDGRCAPPSKGEGKDSPHTPEDLPAPADEAEDDVGLSMEKVIEAVRRSCEDFQLDCDFGKASEFLAENWEKLPGDLGDIVEKVLGHLRNTSTKSVKKSRQKRRVMTKNLEHLWGRGQIPYTWAKDKPFDERTKQLIKGNMARISSQTCITFHEWYSGIEKDHPGMRPGRLLIGDYSGCWSDVGYRGDSTISTCSWGIAIQHELGHAMGLVHEHQSPDRNKYLKSYPENRGSKSDVSDLFLFTMTNEYSNYNISYDLDSAMSGEVPRRGDSNLITYDTLDKNARYLVLSSDIGLSFLDLKSINLAYSCFERFCKGKTLICENQGYPTFADGKCKCNCPKGIAGDRCEKVYTVPTSKEWPSGNYGLPMPVDTGCPAGTWSTGQRVHRNDRQITRFSSVTPELIPQWRSENVDNVYFDFCIKKGTEGTEKLPKGTYCIYKVGDSCPSGPWEEGSLESSGGRGLSVSGTLPSGTFTKKETKLKYCCRFDRQGTYKAPMIFPHTKPFYLFPATKECQEVQGMIHKRQYVWMSITKNEIVEPIPYHTVYFNTVFMNLCYYYPRTDGPGEVFELTPEKPEKIITSQGYPNKYPRGLQQHWLAKVPKGGLVQLEFLDFDVYYNPKDEQCIDYLEPSVYGVEMPGKRLCGDRNHVTKSVTSKTNYMTIKFLSQSIAGGKGFKIKVKGIFPNQLCYKLSDGGTSYRGTVSFTQNYKPCLPWDEVRHCPYNTFDPRSVGSGVAGNNYCRNPSKITQPWCYIDAVDCVQDMCDACLLDNCHDVYDDCAENIALDSDYCTTNANAFSDCHRSCGFCKTPDPVLSCGSPPTSDSAIILGPRKSKYAVGDVVEYECKESGIKGAMKRTCLSDGTWSDASTECLGCKQGYEEFDGRCYKFYKAWYSLDAAIVKCKADDPSYYPAAICDLKKKEFIDKLLSRQKLKTKYLHTGIRVQNDGKLKCTDGSDFPVLQADWVPWSDNEVPRIFPAGKVIINENNEWVVRPMTYPVSLVCEGKPPGERKCHDRQPDCQELLKKNPDVCLNENTFARKQCRWSCGVCKDSANPGKRCTAPARLGKATRIGKATLSLGETAQYKCISGYVKLDGHLERVCLADGSLGGTDPQCFSEAKMSFVIGRNHIYLQEREDYWGSMIIDTSMKVPKASKAVAFFFYSKHDSELALQVWRKKKTKTFILIGEHIVTTKKDRHMYVKIDPEEQILMQKGDYIGWKNMKGRDSPLTFAKCEEEYMAHFEDTIYRVANAYKKTFKVSKSVKFDLMVGDCKNYSLQVVGHPVADDTPERCKVPYADDPITKVPNSKVSYENSIEYRCMPGYVPDRENTVLTCLPNFKWSAPAPTCMKDPTTASVPSTTTTPTPEVTTTISEETTATPAMCSAGMREHLALIKTYAPETWLQLLEYYPCLKSIVLSGILG